MSPRWRKLALTCHVMASVGWLGAVAVFGALGLLAMTSADLALARAVYLVLEPAGWLVLVPLGVAALVTGLVQSLGTPWGLFRHYWVIFKLVINLVAVAVLLLYLQTLAVLAEAAAEASLTAHHEALLRSPSVTVHAVLALGLLSAATGLAVYKPRGLTARGRRSRATPQRWQASAEKRRAAG